MNKFKVIRIEYPGLFAIQSNIWIPFFQDKEKFAFMIGSISKGLVIYDPKNEIIHVTEKDLKLKSIIEAPRLPYLNLRPQGKNMSISFSNVLENDPRKGRTFFEQPYTELYLLLEENNKPLTLESVKSYLQLFFTRYNCSCLTSTLLKPEPSYWNESIIVLQSLFESDAPFEIVIKSNLDLNLPFKLIEVFIGSSKYGILPASSKYFKNENELPSIPPKYYDIFELFASGVMQLNHFKNYKLALLESFVAVEILVIRITNEKKESRGISKTKIKDVKQRVDLAYRMDIELRLFFDFSQNEEILISKAVRARQIRNKIMHENQQTNKQEIISLISDIREFLFMMIHKHES